MKGTMHSAVRDERLLVTCQLENNWETAECRSLTMRPALRPGEAIWARVRGDVLEMVAPRLCGTFRGRIAWRTGLGVTGGLSDAYSAELGYEYNRATVERTGRLAARADGRSQ